jgi:ribosome-associated toxin RatA of RatAB toxin-antitoxin module
MNPDSSRGQLLGGGVAVCVLSERTEEINLSSQPGQHDRRHPAAAGGPGRGRAGVADLAPPGEPVELDEVHPLDVSHDGDAHHCARVRRENPHDQAGGVMAKLSGSSRAEIEAPLAEVWDLVADVERAPEWQGGLRGLWAIERDAEGRATLCESETDGKVRTIKSTVRFAYEQPHRLSWSQEEGELKSVEGSWVLEDLDGERTRAIYELEVDLGRMLGLVIRGPLVDLLRGMLVNARAGELKAAVEGR